jgi:hypothetical protein
MKSTTLEIRVMGVGEVTNIKNSKGETVRRAPVIIADTSSAIKCMFDEKVVSTARTALTREKVAM